MTKRLASRPSIIVDSWECRHCRTKATSKCPWDRSVCPNDDESEESHDGVGYNDFTLMCYLVNLKEVPKKATLGHTDLDHQLVSPLTKFDLTIRRQVVDTKDPNGESHQKYFKRILSTLGKMSDQQWATLLCKRHDWIPDVAKYEFPKGDNGKYLPAYCMFYEDHEHDWDRNTKDE